MKEYLKPDIEIIDIKQGDVITSSPNQLDNDLLDGEWPDFDF